MNLKYYKSHYCSDIENVENFEKAKADNFIGWHCHHRLETHTPDGERRLIDISYKELIALGLYYHRPAEELIFLTTREHNAFKKGKHPSEETRKKISEGNKGKRAGEKNPFYGKHHSEEAKKKNAEAHKGKHLGKDNPFYGKHHSDELKKKLSEINKVRMKGMRFFNNGKINIRAKECPEGFTPGRLRKTIS